MQIFVSLVGVPSQDILVGSKRAPAAPVIGPSGASRPIRPRTVPSFGATSYRELAAARLPPAGMFCGIRVGLPGRCAPMCWATVRAQRSYPPPTPKPMIIRKALPASALGGWGTGWAAGGPAALNNISPINPAAAVLLAMSVLPLRLAPLYQAHADDQ